MKHRRIRRPLAALVAVLVLFSLAARARAAPAPSLDEANRAFGEGRYAEAATDLEALIARDGYSAPLLFDLGNAYLRDRKPGRAILAYQRAELLAPHDAAIATNLVAARAAAGISADQSGVARVAHVLPMSTWSWLAAGGFWLTAGALLVAWGSERRRSVYLGAALGGALAAATAAGALAVSRSDLSCGVVMATAPVLVSPFNAAQAEFDLPAGASVELRQSRDGYVFVRDATGRSGWVERAQLEPLVPPRS